jgi:hypothetical protein
MRDIQGIEKSKIKARRTLYWPNMAQQIEEIVQKCQICEKFQNKNYKEPLMPHSIPERPWKKLGSDILEIGQETYLVIIDYYSKWLEIIKLKKKTAGEIIEKLEETFAAHGIPETMIADNMPYGSVEMKTFAKEWDFEITTSSPRYPQSNGMAERAVQTAKKIIKKSKEENKSIAVALLDYRSTPVTAMNESPAQLLMSRNLKNKLPVTEKSLKPKCQTGVNRRLQQRQQKQKYYYDRNTRALPELKPGDQIRIRKEGKWEKAQVMQKHKSPRSYIVMTENNQKYRRNRRDLKKSYTTKETEAKMQRKEIQGTKEKRIRRRPTWMKDYRMEGEMK